MAVMWNADLDKQFLQMDREKWPVGRMAAHFGTTTAAIYAHRRVISALIQPHRAWTTNDKNRLAALLADGTSIREVCTLLDRSEGSVRHMMGMLNLRPAKARFAREPAAIATVRDMVAAGATAADIAARHGVTPDTVRTRLKNLGIALVKPVRPARPRRAARGQPGRPVQVGRLDDAQAALVRDRLGKVSLRAIARELRMGVATFKRRAAITGIEIVVSTRRMGAPVTLEALQALAARGLSLTEAAREMGRDSRTIALVAKEADIAFRTRKKAPARAAAQEPKPLRRKAAPPPKPAAISKKPAAAPVARPRSVVARVVDTPAAGARMKAPQTPHKPTRWNSFAGAARQPAVVFRQNEVDAAVARFIAERGVTRLAAAGDDCPVARARRLGYVVLRNKSGFVVDNRYEFGSVDDLAKFVETRAAGT